jgi:hypothetical protein
MPPRARTAFGLALLVLLAGGLIAGCKCEKDDPPPIPTAAPDPPKPDVHVIVPPEEDAAEEIPDASDAGKQPGTAGSPAASLLRCCAAINQNAENAPEPTKSLMKQAAATCSAAAKQGNAAAVSAAARQYGIACK